MNQILMTENKKQKKQTKQKNNGPLEIKSIVRFFAIVIIIFGVFLVGQGSYALYKDAVDRDPKNIPAVTLSRLNDTAILYVEHSTEISKIIYSWDNGEETVLPEGGTTAQEEILLPNQNSTLNITIEDMEGKQVNYQKLYYLDGIDITKPSIVIDAQNGNRKMIIRATDETEIKSLTYKWEDEEPIVILADSAGQTEITKEIDLTPGTKKIKVTAEDANSNVDIIEQEIIATTSEPKIELDRNGKQLFMNISDEDGIRNIKVNLNGKEFEGNTNRKEVRIGPFDLREGNNTILVEVTNVSGYTKKGSTEITYNP